MGGELQALQIGSGVVGQEQLLTGPFNSPVSFYLTAHRRSGKILELVLWESHRGSV